MKLSKFFLTKQQRFSRSWQQLAIHYNQCVAAGVSENGKLSIDEHAYLTEVQNELKNRPDNPQNFVLGDMPEIRKEN